MTSTIINGFHKLGGVARQGVHGLAEGKASGAMRVVGGAVAKTYGPQLLVKTCSVVAQRVLGPTAGVMAAAAFAPAVVPVAVPIVAFAAGIGADLAVRGLAMGVRAAITPKKPINDKEVKIEEFAPIEQGIEQEIPEEI